MPELICRSEARRTVVGEMNSSFRLCAGVDGARNCGSDLIFFEQKLNLA